MWLNRPSHRRALAASMLCAVALLSLAGAAQKWDDVPKPVRETVLPDGGKEGNEVDKEPKKSTARRSTKRPSWPRPAPSTISSSPRREAGSDQGGGRGGRGAGAGGSREEAAGGREV
jgi:hypothetical protein